MKTDKRVPLEITYYYDPTAARELRAYIFALAEKGRKLREQQAQANNHNPQAS